MILEILLLILAALGALFIHELGHYVVARWYGMKIIGVTVGFGPEVLGFSDRNGTRWTLAIFPLGGSCRFIEPLDLAMKSAPMAERHSKLISVNNLKAKIAIFSAGPIISIVLSIVIWLTALFLFGRSNWLAVDILHPSTPFFLVAAFSLSIGLCNLLPIPPLDGGQLLIFSVEACHGNQLHPAVQQLMQIVGFIFLLIISLAFIIHEMFGPF